MLLCCNVAPFVIFRSISRCQGWLWTVDRWPSVSLPQPWVDGLPLDPARLWARSYGNEYLSGLTGRDESELRKVQSISLYFSVFNHRGHKKTPNWSPFPSRTSLQNMCISLIPRPFSLSLFLSCVSELGVKQDYSLAVSACRMVFDYHFYFPFLGKRKYKQR